MKQIGKDILTALIMGVLVPALVLRLGVAVMERREEIARTEPEQTQADSQPQEAPVTEETAAPVTMAILVRRGDGTVSEEDLEDYLLGAVLGEMPADFELEALKAQAVAARTYAMAAKESMKHGDGSICTDYTCCQAYISPEDYRNQGGSLGSIQRIRDAIRDTRGLVLLYEGELIEATYFSCSGGRTEDAAAVWGTEVPYLQSVESPGEEGAAHFTDRVFISREELLEKLNITSIEVGPVTYTEGGGVAVLTLGNREFSGTALRTLLGLRSTAFTLEEDGSGLVFVTRGFGHRVGMSQYGADAMAVTGAVFPEILAHYYPGTTLAEDYGCNLYEDVIK